MSIEYIAHAAFVVQSPGGTRIAIDPYNGNISLGYAFPDDVTADAVLVSHPHYDHDATYYFGNDTPVFRTPRDYRVGDVTLRGLAGEHFDRTTFLDRGQEPLNTIWVIESGGLRIGHLGDNRPLDEADLEALGDIDVLLVNAAYFEASSADLLALLLEATTPRVLIPMHYRHHEISELPRALRPVGDQLADHPAEYSASNVIELSAAAAPAQQQIVVLKPSPAIEPWPESLHEAWIEAAEGAGLLADAETERDAARAEEALWEGLSHYEAAMDLAPHVLAFGHGAGDALSRLNEVNDAIETLDHALARAPQADWTDRLRAHILLGELYERGGRPDIAVEHYEYVAGQAHTHETTMRQRAIARLAALRASSSAPTGSPSNVRAGSAGAPGPRNEACSSATLMLDDGWWLQVRADRPASIGYGALLQRIPIRVGVIDPGDVCALIADHVRDWQPKGEVAEEHFFTVVYGSDGRVYDIGRDAYPQLFELFRRAYRRRDPDAHALPSEVETVERFWQGAFFLESR